MSFLTARPFPGNGVNAMRRQSRCSEQSFSASVFRPAASVSLCRSKLCQHGSATASQACPSFSAEASSHAGSTDRQQQAQQQVHQQGDAVQTAVLLKERLSSCAVCGGTGRVACKDCSGRGELPRGGYSKKNPLNLHRAIGGKWTAMVNTLGWRHFRVIAVRKLDNQKHNTYLLLQASCDSSAQLWVNALVLRNRSCWAAGWLQMSELSADAEGLPTSTGHKCHTCAGLGFRACLACDGRGRAELVQVP